MRFDDAHSDWVSDLVFWLYLPWLYLLWLYLPWLYLPWLYLPWLYLQVSDLMYLPSLQSGSLLSAGK